MTAAVDPLDRDLEVRTQKYNAPRIWACEDGTFAVIGMYNSREALLPIEALGLTAEEALRAIISHCESVRHEQLLVAARASQPRAPRSTTPSLEDIL